MAKLAMPFSNPYTYPGHSGIDYGVWYGSPIRSSQAGRITRSEWFNDRSGYMRELDHGNGVCERAYHIEDLDGPRIGATVGAGVTWAWSGNTGSLTTGPHLHHEIWVNGVLKSGNEYWWYVDRNHYVGDGTLAGGGSKPLPTPEPIIPLDRGAEMPYRAKSSKSGIWYVIPDLAPVTKIAAGEKWSENYKHALAYSHAAETAFPVLPSTEIQQLLDDNAQRRIEFFGAMGLTGEVDRVIAEIAELKAAEGEESEPITMRDITEAVAQAIAEAQLGGLGEEQIAAAVRAGLEGAQVSIKPGSIQAIADGVLDEQAERLKD